MTTPTAAPGGGDQDRPPVRNYRRGRTHPRVARSLPGVMDGVTRAVAVRAEEIVAFLLVFMLGLLLMPLWSALLPPVLTLVLLLAVPLAAAAGLRLLHLEGRRAPQLLRGWLTLTVSRLLARRGVTAGRPRRAPPTSRPAPATVLVLATATAATTTPGRRG